MAKPSVASEPAVDPPDTLDRTVTVAGQALRQPASKADWVGATLSGGRYKVLRKLGEGGMGLVYQAHDAHLSTKVVIKVPHPQWLHRADFAARFARETRSLVRLSHPRVCPILDVGEHEGAPFAVIRYLAGGGLEDRSPKSSDGRPLPGDLGQRMTWLPGLAEALDFIHGLGHVHRDLKPGNVLFDAHGNVYLSDFGIVKVLGAEAGGSNLTGTDMIVGTAGYMAPEVVLGQPYDGRADQYALGVMVYQWLCGRKPFDGPTAAAILLKQTSQPAPDPRHFAPGLPEGVVQAVMKALSLTPSMRHASCAAMVRAIAAGRSGPPPLPAPVMPAANPFAVAPLGPPPFPMPPMVRVPPPAAACCPPAVASGASPKGAGSHVWKWVALGVVASLLVAVGLTLAVRLLRQSAPTATPVIERPPEAWRPPDPWPPTTPTQPAVMPPMPQFPTSPTPFGPNVPPGFGPSQSPIGPSSFGSEEMERFRKEAQSQRDQTMQRARQNLEDAQRRAEEHRQRMPGPNFGY